MQQLDRSFYDRDPKTVAIDLLGKRLFREHKHGPLIGGIVETEAYYGASDPASKAYGNRRTKLSSWMWSRPGTVFVYMIHARWLLNIITGEAPSAVLIRALEPVQGIDIMKENRGAHAKLTSGPCRLTQAFEIGREFLGIDICSEDSKLKILDSGEEVKFFSADRIGVKQSELEPLRFYCDSEFLSRKPIKRDIVIKQEVLLKDEASFV